MKISLILAAFMFFCQCAGAPVYGSASVPGPGTIKPDSPPPRPGKSGVMCRIKGKVYCSEYGTRYKQPVLILLDDGVDRYGSHVGENDGNFDFDVPCGAAYTIRIEFSGKAREVGRLEIPASETNISRTLELFHPGSMLELIWQIRDEGKVEIDFRIKEEPRLNK